MKLSNLQKHYMKVFKNLRKFIKEGSVPVYVNLSNDNPGAAYKASKRTNQFAKYLGVKILLATGPGARKNFSLQANAPHVLDVICTINDIPCLIVFLGNKLHAIHMGYDEIEDTFYNEIVLPKHSISRGKIYASSVRSETSTNKDNKENELIFKFKISTHQLYGTQKLDSVLNDIIDAYNITEEPITEELQFQLDTIQEHTQYYLPVYQRALHIQNNINSVLHKGKKCTVLQLLRYSAGL